MSDSYIDADTDPVPGWSDAGGNYVDLALTPGTAVWVKTPDGSAATTASGAVATEAAAITVKADKFTLLGNAYPVAVTLNSKQMTCDGIEGVNYDGEFYFQKIAPQIQVQKTSGGYDTYYYLNDAYIDADTDPVPGWSDAGGNYVTDTIPAGKGFWLKAASDVKVTFNL